MCRLDSVTHNKSWGLAYLSKLVIYSITFSCTVSKRVRVCACLSIGRVWLEKGLTQNVNRSFQCLINSGWLIIPTPSPPLPLSSHRLSPSSHSSQHVRRVCVVVGVQPELNANVMVGGGAVAVGITLFECSRLSFCASEYGGHREQPGQAALWSPPPRQLPAATDWPVSLLCAFFTPSFFDGDTIKFFCLRFSKRPRASFHTSVFPQHFTVCPFFVIGDSCAVNAAAWLPISTSRMEKESNRPVWSGALIPHFVSGRPVCAAGHHSSVFWSPLVVLTAALLTADNRPGISAAASAYASFN